MNTLKQVTTIYEKGDHRQLMLPGYQIAAYQEDTVVGLKCMSFVVHKLECCIMSLHEHILLEACSHT
jgi:hypothetical protein